jgi:hypothetical protein
MLSTFTWLRNLTLNSCFGKRRKLHGLRSCDYGGFETTEETFCSKHLSRRGHCDREYSCDAASNCPHLAFLCQKFWTNWWFKLNSLPLILTVKRQSVLTTNHSGHIFFRFCRAISFRRCSYSTISHQAKIPPATYKLVLSIQKALIKTTLFFHNFLLCFH